MTFTMIYVKAGTFMMGAAADEPNSNSWEKPAHKVTLTKDYYMGEYEMTYHPLVIYDKGIFCLCYYCLAE